MHNTHMYGDSKHKRYILQVRRFGRLLKPGGVVIGYAGGARVGQEWAKTPDNTSQRYLYDIEGLTTLFKEAGFTGMVDVVVNDSYVPTADPSGNNTPVDDKWILLQFTASK